MLLILIFFWIKGTNISFCTIPTQVENLFPMSWKFEFQSGSWKTFDIGHNIVMDSIKKVILIVSIIRIQRKVSVIQSISLPSKWLQRTINAMQVLFLIFHRDTTTMCYSEAWRGKEWIKKGYNSWVIIIK